MLTFDQVMELVRKENEYGQRWAKGSRKISIVEGVSDADVHAGTTGFNGTPFSIGDWMLFAKKYWDEAELTMANFTPDGGAVRIRLIKVISLLVRCLMLYGHPLDLERLAGKSSNDFPVLHGGLKTFEKTTTNEGCMLPSGDTGRLRNESPNCDPLHKETK